MNFDRKKDRLENNYCCLGCEYCRRCRVEVEFTKLMSQAVVRMSPDVYRNFPMTVIIKLYDSAGHTYRTVNRDSFLYCRKGLDILRDAVQNAYAKILKEDYEYGDEYREDVLLAYKEIMNFCNYHLAIHKSFKPP
jgi:hypothetical protein